MPAKRFGRTQKATALVPLALLSAAWTASLAGAGGPATSSAAEPTGSTSLADGTSVPSRAIEAPASVSSPDEVGSVFAKAEHDVQQIVATSSTNGIPSAALAAYQRAETVINAADAACNLSWQLVAAIGRVESDHGRFGGSALDANGIAVPGIIGIALDGNRGTALISDTDAGQYDNDRLFDRAVGPMQFIPSTWSAVGVDADNDGVRNPQDIDDAALGTAVYLCSGTGDLSTLAGQQEAVYRYNHSDSYVDLVLKIADNYLAGDFMTVPNNTTAAGFLSPLPTLEQGPKNTKPEKSDQAEPAPETVEPEAEPTEEPAEEPTAEPDKEKPKGITLPEVPGLPPVTIPALPQTSIKPVDDVLTLAQALVQCTLDGLLDNPLNPADKFDVCVTEYTTKP